MIASIYATAGLGVLAIYIVYGERTFKLATKSAVSSSVNCDI
jgi:hypothetical protein